MKPLIWISMAACIIYGAMALFIYQTKRADATMESRNLQQVEATVESIQRCPGKGVCYFSVAKFRIDGKATEIKVPGKIGQEGTTVSLWVIPGAKWGFVSHAAYIEHATDFLPFLFIPLAVFLFPLGLAITEKHDQSNAQKNQNTAFQKQ